jgi:hypothetical protein
MATKKTYSPKYIETRRTCLRAAIATVFTPMLGGCLGGGSGSNDGATASTTPPTTPALVYDTRIGLGSDSDGIPILVKDTNAQYIYWNPIHPNANDANPGTDPSLPKLTLPSAWSALRNGFGDWLLLAQGATTPSGFGNVPSRSGLSAQYPIVITTYDPATPSTMRQGTVTIGSDFSTGNNATTTSKLVFETIIFDNAALGIAPVSLLTNLSGSVSRDTLFHNVRFLRTHVNAENYTGDDNDRIANIIFRHCTFAYAYWGSSHAQGLYLFKTDGITVEDCVFYHNGWIVSRNEVDGANIFKHNAYFGTLTFNTIFRRNVSGHASSHGIQARGGGTIDNNVFASNPIGALIGGGTLYNVYRPTGVPYTFNSNVVVGSADIDPGLPRGFGVWFSNTQTGGSANDNLIVNIGPLSTPPNNQWALRPYDTAQFNQPTYINWTNNIEWNWNFNFGTSNYAGNTLAVTIASSTFPGQIFLTRSDNITHYETPSGTNLQAPSSAFPDPGRTLATFATANGYANEDALWSAMIANPKTHWAGQIRSYIRTGFGRV